MKEEARKLRMEGLSYSEIATKINVSDRKVRYWTGDIKLSKEQVAEKIRQTRKLSSEKRYKETCVDKELLQASLLNNGFYKTLRLMGLTEGIARYWCNQYDIEIRIKKRKDMLHVRCNLCNKIYNTMQCKKKICNTCVSKLRRRLSKIKAINYLGGKCEKCNYAITDENPAGFEFHHPEDNKETEIGRILNRKWEIIEKELCKCKLLCSNCHRILHSDYQNGKLICSAKEKYVRDNEINKIKILIETGRTVVQKDIDKKAGTNSVGDLIKENNRLNILIKDEEIRNLVRTESVIKIANKFGVSPYVIIKICENKNIEIPDKHDLQKKFNVSKEELENLVKTKPMIQIGKIFCVSDSAIRKRCNRLGIDWRGVSPFSHKMTIEETETK